MFTTPPKRSVIAVTFVKNEGWAVRLKREVGNGLELFLKTPLT